MSQREALMRLGASTAAAVAGVLETLVPDGISRGDVSVIVDGGSPFFSLPIPAVAAGVAYVDGATGGNIFVVTVDGARQLAAAMMGMPEPETSEGDLSEMELSAVSEAANQMLAAAASAISVVLGDEVEIDPPKTIKLDNHDIAEETFGTAPFATSTTFGIRGHQARLIQLVPNTFVARMTRALDELASREALEGNKVGGEEHPERMGLVDALRDINVRVWVELGRARLGLGRAVSLPDGAVVELDRAAEAPVDLFVNGLSFGTGELVVTDDGEWAVRVLNLNRPTADTVNMEGAVV